MFGLFFGVVIGAISTYFYNTLYGDASKNKGLPAARSNFTAPSSSGALAAASSVTRSGSFLTDLIASIWTQVNEAVCTEIKNTVEPMFKDMLPGPLKTLHFTKLDLGSVPLRLDNCIVHECKTNMNGTKYVAMELDVVWDGQCDIELKADYIGALGVKHLKLAGRMSIIMQPLVSVIPVVGAVQYAFVNPPTLELDFTGLANVADISSIKTTIDKTIQDILAGMLVLPNRMLTKLDDVQGSFFEAYQHPLGVARISVVRGRGFQEEQRSLRKADIPDVYCRLTLGATEIWTTEVVKNSLNPVFSKDETADVLLFDYDQVLTVEVFDKDEGMMESDDPLGSAQLTVGDILLSGKSKEVALQVDNRCNGAFILLHCDLLKLESKPDGGVVAKSAVKNSKIHGGLLTILLAQALNIPQPEEKDAPPVNYFVKIQYGDKDYFSAVVDGACAVFDSAYRIPVSPSDAVADAVSFALYRGAAAEDNDDNVLIGKFDVSGKSILDASKCTLSEKRSLVADGPELEYQIFFDTTEKASTIITDAPQIVEESLGSSNAGTNSTSAGSMVEVKVAKGWGFQEEKRRLKKSDVPDVYCNIQFGSSPTIWRTATIQNSLSPTWDESKSFRMQDHGQIISISAFDEDGGRNDEDDALGSARVSVGKILLAGGNFDVELQLDGKPTGCYVNIQCKVVSEPSAQPSPLPLAPAASKAAAPAIELTPVASEAERESAKIVESVVDHVLDSASMEAPSISESIPVQAPAAEPEPPTPINSIVLTAVSGSGFEIERRKFGKDDIPDVYCKVTVGSSCEPWQTETVKNDLAPVWNASKNFSIGNQDDVVCLEAYDEDKGISKDDLLGKATVSVRQLLEAGDEGVSLDLLSKGESSGCCVVLRCQAA